MPRLESVNKTAKTTNDTWSLNWSGGKGVFHGEGTWDGATATLRIRDVDGAAGTGTALGSETTLTADGGGMFYSRAGILDIVVTGGGESSQSLYFHVEKVYE